MHRLLVAVIVSISLNVYAQTDEQLPRLGDAASGLISMEQEYALGRTWLRQLRQQASSINDPLLTEYTENLVYRLAIHSQVSDRRFEIIILNNPQLNAFAVPGGIIGINAGLYLHAQTEAQFASVVAHELAHLSQRHFARRLEEGRKQTPIALASLLGSLLLIATNNTEAGFAGLVTSQAAATQNALSYSRDWEREADRIGFKTLVDAKIDPAGMPQMFEQMYNAHRYSQRPPEFLLTHPITANRISDAAARADNTNIDIQPEDFEYALRRTALLIRYRPESHSITHYEKQLETAQHPRVKQMARYALAKLHLQQNNEKQALTYINPLLEDDSHRISYQVLYAKIKFAMGQQREALNYLEELLQLSPGNHSLTMTYVELLGNDQQYHQAATILRGHVPSREYDANLWQTLSELEGKAGNRVGTLRARAEYLFLTGRKDQALQQLKQALELSREQYLISARIEQRARDMARSAEELSF